MTSNRANLNNLGNNSTYLVLAVILIILSVVGILLFFQIQKTNPKSILVTDNLPTQNLPSPIPSVSSPSANVVSPTSVVTTATTSIPQPSLSLPEPTPTYKTYRNDTDKFTAIYQASRKLYSDVENTGNRYIFYSSLGNITVHVGPKWSWAYPDRQFSQSLLVSGYPTFIYDIDSQTITDFQVGQQLFTIQCIHHNVSSLKLECQQFLSDFKTN